MAAASTVWVVILSVSCAVLFLAVAVMVVWGAQARGVLSWTANSSQWGLPTTVLLTDPGVLQELRDLLALFFRDVVAPAQIDGSVWLTSGTLLGAMRSGDVLQWDDDIDVAVLDSAVQRLTSAAERAGWKWRRFHCFLKFSAPSFPKHELDVFPCKDNGATVKSPCVLWPEYHDRNDLFPLARAPFGGGTYPVPRDPGPYLSRNYGADWKDRCCSGWTWTHVRHPAMGVFQRVPWLWSTFAISNPLLVRACFGCSNAPVQKSQL